MAAKKSQPGMASMVRRVSQNQAMRMDQMLDKRLGPRDKTDRQPKRKGK